MKTGNKEQEVQPVIPPMIALRTAWLRPILKKWRAENPDADWVAFAHLAIRESASVKRLAGKKNAHLLAA